MRDTVDLLDHRSPLLVEQRLAVLVARLALERPRPAELLPGLHVLALQHRDQLLPLDRLTAPHPEPRQSILRTQPQRRSRPLRDALGLLDLQLVVSACERLRRSRGLEPVVARPRSVRAVSDLDHDLRQRQHSGSGSSSCTELMVRSVARHPDGVRLVWCD